MTSLQIVEVGLRDGLQNEEQVLSLNSRLTLVKKLSFAGLKRIELGSFASPRWVPQMACVAAFTKKVLKLQTLKALPHDISYSAFVPNFKGFEKARACGLKEVAVFISCTDSFSKKNINKNIRESFVDLKRICLQARGQGIKVRAYLSVVVACPYEGRVRPGRASELVVQILRAGVSEVSLSDTIGEAGPLEIKALLRALRKKKVSLKKIALHLHDRRGLALVCVAEGFKEGVRVFDSSLGGLGGCPYASGACGNVATEDMTWLFKKLNCPTRVDIKKLMEATKFLEKKLKRPLPVKTS